MSQIFISENVKHIHCSLLKLLYLVEEILNAHIVRALHGLHHDVDADAAAADDDDDEDHDNVADDDAVDDDDGLHLLLDVPQLLLVLLRLKLICCFDVLKVGDPDLKVN